ncbi:ATP-dependent helicase [Thraustotheca clavata]|uniref:ATP-dependent helicase n=1 Tax=Thraustotheca clavata TaxID=74557 RepID=A0A1V9YRS7_9STRA|nr:ATP-dependent helicase [Thraustotheca clavata]
MAAIKELLTGKVVSLHKNEIPVCGAVAVVRVLKDGKITLRVRKPGSIIVNRRNKQSILKKGMSSQLEINDVFCLNGSMSKYTVVPSEEEKDEEPLIEVASVEPPTKIRRTIVEDDSSDNDDYAVPVKTTRRNTVLVDSDEDTKASTTGESTPPNKSYDEVESIDEDEEDDVFKLQDNKKVIEEKNTSWMDKYRNGFFESKKSEEDNGWVTAPRLRKLGTDSWTAKKMEKFKKPAPKVRVPRKRVVLSSSEEEDEAESSEDEKSDGLDESEKDRPTSTRRSQKDEVAAILQTCSDLAENLRVSLSKWSTKDVGITDEETNLVNVDTAQLLKMNDIPGLDSKLVLQPYQLVGVNWLYLLYQHNMSAVLADEMGLGKTVQTIAFLSLITNRQKKKPHFVVVPASTLSNWQRELARFAPSLQVVAYHGAKEERMALHSEREFDILLTTYSYFERDTCVEDRAFFRKFNFSYIVLDEGHSIKNAKTSRFKRIAAVRARHRLVLSGTPIQNNLSELLALLSFLMPTIFNHGSEQMMEFFAGEPQSATCTKIRRILAPFILRRMKKYVLMQMVPKTEETHILTLADDQQDIYNGLVAAAVAKKENDKAKVATRKTQAEELHGKNNREVRTLSNIATNIFDGQNDTAIFTQLRKAANHPILLRHHFNSASKMKVLSKHLYKLGAFGNQCTLSMVEKEIETYSDFDLHELCVQYSDVSPELRALQLSEDVLLNSAKLKFLQTLLPNLKQDDHRVLIFSQWTKLLDLIEVLMDHLGYRYLRLDGSTNVADRQAMIDEFNDDPSIFAFLLSTRAGGLGINLTAADTVILHDLDFNPTIDAQACDRCHRIGQTKPVTIHKLVAQGTVDDAIYTIAQQKTQLNDAVLGELGKIRQGKSKSSELGAADVQAILSSVLSSYTKNA